MKWTNAVDNAMKGTLNRRYDCRGKGHFEFKDKEQTGCILTGDAEFQR